MTITERTSILLFVLLVAGGCGAMKPLDVPLTLPEKEQLWQQFGPLDVAMKNAETQPKVVEAVSQILAGPDKSPAPVEDVNVEPDAEPSTPASKVIAQVQSPSKEALTVLVNRLAATPASSGGGIPGIAIYAGEALAAAYAAWLLARKRYTGRLLTKQTPLESALTAAAKTEAKRAADRPPGPINPAAAEAIKSLKTIGA